MFPVVAKRVAVLRRTIPGAVFDFAKFFGSGVILTTSIIHLLEPAADEEINGDKCVLPVANTCLMVSRLTVILLFLRPASTPTVVASPTPGETTLGPSESA